MPLHRKIDKGRGEERDRHFAAGFLDVDVMDLIRAAPQMERDRRHMGAIARNFRELAIDVIAHPNREIGVHDHERRHYDERYPEPPTFSQRFHATAPNAPNLQLYLKNAAIDVVGHDGQLGAIEVNRPYLPVGGGLMIGKANVAVGDADGVAEAPAAGDIVDVGEGEGVGVGVGGGGMIFIQ